MNPASPRPGARLASFVRWAFLCWENPILAAVLTGVIFLGIRSFASPPWLNSPAPYYNYLADAFLHGQIYLRLVPSFTSDLILFSGKYYLYWGPLPALLAVPLVAIFGIQASDVLQTIAMGALNVGLFAFLLRRVEHRGFISLSLNQRAALVIFFGLGTAQAPILPPGGVWFLSQVESITAVLLAFLAVFTLRGVSAFWWMGCAVGGILLTRSSAVFAGLFPIWYLLSTHRTQNWRHLVWMSMIGLSPILVTVALLGSYNFVRFGNPLDMGLSYHLMADQFKDMARQYGVLSVHYIPVNLFLNYIFYPFFDFVSGNVRLVPLGGSLFLLSPLFLAAPYAIRQKPKDMDLWVLAFTFLLGNIPDLIVMAPGSVHFGPRYLLDTVVPLLLLTARGMRRWPTALTAVCVALSVVQYIIGTIGFLYL